MCREVSHYSHSSSLILEDYALETVILPKRYLSNGNADFDHR